MTTLFLSPVLFALLTMPMHQYSDLQPSSIEIIATEDAGFVEAVFLKAEIQEILSQNKCEGIRIYNAKPTTTSSVGTAMAIGIDRDGKELNGFFWNKCYLRSDGITGGAVQFTDLSRSVAEDHTVNLTTAGLKTYSAEFSKTKLQSMLEVPNCSILRVSPSESTSGNLTMLVHAAQISGDSAQDIGGGPEVEAIDQDPCPVMCGDAQNYLNQR